MTEKKKQDIGVLKGCLEEYMEDDPGYAWSWQCNLAMASFDEGLSRARANRAAARFMCVLFGIDMTKHPNYADTQKDSHAEVKVVEVTSALEVSRLLDEDWILKGVAAGQEEEGAPCFLYSLMKLSEFDAELNRRRH